MGAITSGIGLASGIDTASLISQLLALEARGKLPLQRRVASLQAQQGAMLDINSRLLNLKDASATFKRDDIFKSALATSSDETTIFATAGTTAQPGSYTFIVKQLVTSSQKLSSGFVDASSTPVGLSELSFEFGNGKLDRDVELADLNGGTGVRRGKIQITDYSGSSGFVDLSEATTIDEVLDAINSSTDVSVTATISGDGLVITDNTGLGTGTITVANASGDFTATDLGIAGSATDSAITGTDVNTIGENTGLSRLNDGNGVFIRDNSVVDFQIRHFDGVTTTDIDINLGRINADIDDDTLLEDLNDGDGVSIDDDTDEADIKITDRDGTEYEIDLTGVETVGQLRSRIAAATAGNVTLSVTDGDHFTVTDSTGGSGLLKVEEFGDSDDTAEELGILEETGVAAVTIEGDVIENGDFTPATSTLGQVIERINLAVSDAGLTTGDVLAQISADGLSLEVTSSDGDTITILEAPTGDSSSISETIKDQTLLDLGFTDGQSGTTVTSKRLQGSLNSVLVRNLNGGAGLSGNTSLTINDRDGNSDTFALDEDTSLADIIDLINGSGSINVTVSINDAGNGLLITDNTGSTGSNLTISGTAAAELGIEADVAEDSVRGSNLQLQYVSYGSKLSDLNYGRGVGTGKFRVQDGYGNTADVDIGSDSKTLYDVALEINSKGLAVLARVNDNGDGLIIEEDLTGFTGTPSTTIRVTNVSGTTARDLGILGEAEEVSDAIDGSYEKSVSFNPSDTLNDVVSKINSANIPVNASILNTGSGATPYHVAFTSELTGRRGELVIDSGDVDLGLSTISKAQDAKLFFGSSDPADALLVTSSTNSVSNVVQGVTLDLRQASSDPVTVTVNRDTDTIFGAVERFVTTFNDVIGRINDYDSFDVDTEERGALLGDPTVAITRTRLNNTLQSRVTGVDTQYQYLVEVGIRIGQNGNVTFDRGKFQDAYESDPEAVENLFAAFEESTEATTEIAPGVTVTTTDREFSTLGFGELFNQLLDDLTNSIDGTIKNAQDNFQTLIDATNDRLEDFDERLESKRLFLETQFLAMEEAIAQLQGQSGALSSLAAAAASAQASIL